jgi:glutamyl-tRNA synthetase
MKGVIEKTIRALTLQNAVQYEGKANPGKIVGKILGQYPDLKKDKEDMATVMQRIKATVKEVNALSTDEQQKELDKLGESSPDLLEKKESTKKEIKELENVEEGKVVLRFEPSPSGPMHIGHAYPLMLNFTYAQKYKGRLILRIADTNPDNIDPNAYAMLEQDFNWLCNDVPHQTLIQSDRMELYYTHAVQLIEQTHAYVCTCTGDSFRDSAKNQEECPCRNLGVKEHEQRWKQMFDGFAPGDAVVRLKTNMKHKNPAMRDFPLLRINECEHPRQGKKYRVWPLLNFAVAIDDHDMGLTHVLRGKDHYDNTKRQEYIFDYLQWKKPEYMHIGRINFEGLKVSASETRKAIETGQYTGWDDVRIPFIQALKKRGYQPSAFKKYALSVGVTLVDKKVQANEFFKAINAFNKDSIDATSNRVFFAHDPIAITIQEAPEQEVELDLHPEHRKGGRKFKTGETFYLAKEDYERIKKFDDGALIRLMDCLNFTKKEDQFVFDSTDYEKYKQQGKAIIHWLPGDANLVKVKLQMPDALYAEGLGEEKIKELEPGTTVQFERIGFCRLDRLEGDVFVFCYGHR